MNQKGSPLPDKSGGERAVLSAKNVVLSYSSNLRALDGFSLELGRGCHGLLGQNGAGKSTFMKVVLGLLRPDSGDVSVVGRDAMRERQEVRRRIGYMPERDAYIHGMVAFDYVALMGELSGLRSVAARQRAHEVLHYVDLGDSRNREIDGYSAGMRQRLKLAAALVHDPDILLLDEPTNGLDPKGRRYMLDLIAELRDAGISILVSTHLLPDVQEVCEDVVLVSQGRVVKEGTVADLTRGMRNAWRIRFLGSASRLMKELSSRSIQANLDETSGTIHATTPESADSPTRLILEAALAAEAGIKQLTPGMRSLEEVFVETVEEASHANP